MTVKDIISTCQNGTKIEIHETEFFAEGDLWSIVFENTVGQFAKCNYYDYEIDCLRIIDNTLVMDIHSFRND